MSTFLAADVEDALVGKVEHCLQRERRLADAWFTTQQNDGTWYETTAQHAVQLGIVHVYAGIVVC